MPIRGGWLIEHQVMIAELWGDVSDDEYTEAATSPRLMLEMDRAQGQQVHILFELLDVGKTPSLRTMGQRTQFAQHPKLGWTLLVNFQLNPIARMMGAIAVQVNRSRFRNVETRQQALQTLHRLDPSIPLTPPHEPIWFNFVNWPADRA